MERTVRSARKVPIRPLYLLIIITLTTFFSACGNNGRASEPASETSEAPLSSPAATTPYDKYLESVGITDAMKEMLHYLNRPVEEVAATFGSHYAITSSDPSEKWAMQYCFYSNRLVYDSSITPLEFDISVKGSMMAPSDMVLHVGAGTKGFELAPGFVIGKSASEITSVSGAVFPDDVYKSVPISCGFRIGEDFHFSLEFVDGYLRYIYVWGFGLYSEQSIPDDADSGEITAKKEALKEVLDYYYDRGYQQFDVSAFHYAGSEWIESSGSLWDVWECTGFDGAHDKAIIRAEQDEPYRYFLDQSFTPGLIWMNGSYAHPIAYTQGSWGSSENPDYYLNIRSVTQEGELVFDLILGNLVMEGLGSFLTETESGSYSRLLGADYEAHFDYFNGATSIGLIQYSGKIHGNNASLGFSRSRSKIVLTAGSGKVITFNQRIESNNKVFVTDSPGLLQHFGEDDLSWERCFHQTSSAPAKDKQVLNDYFNTLRKTKGLDYAGKEFQLLGEYFFEALNRHYSVWERIGDSYRYYVDSQSKTVILTWQEETRPFRTKDIPWYQGKITSYANIFAGNWKAEGLQVKIDTVRGERVPLTLVFPEGLLSKWSGNGELVQGVWSDETEESIIGFDFEEGDLNIAGYIHLNPRTMGACLYLNGSNVAGIPCGVYPIHRTSPLFFGMDRLSDENPETEPSKESEAEAPSEARVLRSETIKDFYGKILGTIDYLENGDKIARDFYGVIKGRYFAAENVTKDFYGKILSQGDSLAGLLTKSD